MEPAIFGIVAKKKDLLKFAKQTAFIYHVFKIMTR